MKPIDFCQSANVSYARVRGSTRRLTLKMRASAMLTLLFCGPAFADGCLSFSDIQGWWETEDKASQRKTISFEQESETFFYATTWNQQSLRGQWEISGCTLTVKPEEEHDRLRQGHITFSVTPGRPNLWLAPHGKEKRFVYTIHPE